MFDLDQFIADIRATLPDRSRQGTREVVARAVADPAALLKVLGEPTRAGSTVLHHAPDLTILNIAWGPQQMTMPHDHRLWAVIGMYGGREDNMFWRRAAEANTHQIEIAGGQALGRGDVAVLGRDIIHSVINPVAQLSGAIHVYGGDFFAVERSQWNCATLTEEPFDLKAAQQSFREANARLGLP
ncbi:MAG: hypothetical protein AB7O80_11700 [Acetobacteraceae bacterium]